MPSKRELLKQLKNSRAMNQKPIDELSTPVDEKLNELEDAVIQDKKTDDSIEEVETKEKDTIKTEKKEESKPDNSTDLTPEKKDQNIEKQVTKASNIAKNEQPEEENEIESIAIDKEVEKKEEKELTPETLNTKDESVEEIIEKSDSEAEKIIQNIAKNNLRESKKEPTKRTSMALLVGNNKFIRLRSMQLGLSIQNYINLLIDEEKERQKSCDNSLMEDLIDNLDMNYRRGENSTIVALVLTESNAKYLKRGGAMLGMNSTTFLNYIISEEQNREKQQGPRKGEFDEF